ncbi:hypothetical protein C7Y47_21010 [Lysinibacillus sphaericus]|uniref:Uncharacterized protein n=1 Tax=Lysinibacillus sphaericus TaxID=1421 RepID=A0A544U8V1_LYSSH|nr:hypothetical protein [Lysinibacillus sp. SDF0037]TQR28535.1 hypothetical protein C7Y47_21010 [Lysinibacillus sp. SDF0037]
MKEYFLTEEQYCNNTFVTTIVPLTLRFREKNTYWPKRLNGSLQKSAQSERNSTLRYGDKLKN